MEYVSLDKYLRRIFKSKRERAAISAMLLALSMAKTTKAMDMTTSNEQQRSPGVVAEVVTDLPEAQANALVYGAAFSPDGVLLATRFGWRAISIWNWREKRIVKSLELPEGANDLLVSERLVFSPDGQYLVACHGKAKDDAVVTIWDTRDWTVHHSIREERPGGPCSALSFSPDGKYLYRTASWPTPVGDNLIVHETKKWQIIWGLHANSMEPYNLSVSHDGKTIAIGVRYFPQGESDQSWVAAAGLKNGDSGILIIDEKNRSVERIIRLDQKLNAFSRLAWNPEGDYIASAAGLGLQVFHSKTGQVQINVPTSRLTSSKVSLRYAKSGAYLIEACAYCKPGWAKIWNSSHSNLLQIIDHDVGSLAVSPNGGYLATGEIGRTEIWKPL